jgi:post-segregation antitoxin (ccd killing protein)
MMTRATSTLEAELAAQGRDLDVNISAAAREGVRQAVRVALTHADREAYQRQPEHPDPFWNEVEAWTDG